MWKNVVLIVACLGVVVLAVVVAQQREALEQAQEALAQSRQQAQAAEAKAAEAGTAAQSLRKEEEAVRQELRAVETRMASARTAVPVTGGKGASGATPAHAARTNDAAPFAGIAKMMKNPGMKSMIRAQQQGQMDMSYASLFKGLGLSSEDQAAFKGLLLDKQMALVDLSMSAMDGSATPEQRKDLAARMAELTKSYDEQIKTLLGDEGFAVYQEYESTQPERMQVNIFKQMLSGTDALSEQQEHDLIRALYDERKNYPSIAKQYDRTNPPDPSTFTGSAVTNQLAALAQMQEKNAERAAKVLTAAQLDEFKKSQEQMRSMQEMGLRMAAQMFGGKKDSNAQ